MRQTDRQTSRQTDRQTNRQTDTDTQIHRHRHTNKHTHTHTTHTHTHTHTHIHTHTQDTRYMSLLFADNSPRDGDELRLKSSTSESFHDNSWITLNVGGHIVQTTWFVKLNLVYIHLVSKLYAYDVNTILGTLMIHLGDPIIQYITHYNYHKKLLVD